MKTIMEERMKMICEWFEIEPFDIHCIAFTFHGRLLDTDYCPEYEMYNQRVMFASISKDKVVIAGNHGILRTKEETQ